MSNLTSTVPGAYDAWYNLLKTAGAAQNPAVTVLPQELVQFEPGSYVCLGQTPSGHKAVENHRFTLAALGSFAQYEDYDFCGYVSYVQGNVDPETVLADTWSIYQNVVMSTVVGNRGQFGTGIQVLGPSAPTQLEWIKPEWAEYRGMPGEFGRGRAGFMGIVEFCYSLRARITVP